MEWCEIAPQQSTPSSASSVSPFLTSFWLGNLEMVVGWGGCSPPGQILIWASVLSTPCSFLLSTSFLGGGASIPPESCSTYGGQGAQLRAKACWDSTPFISQLQGWAWTNWLSCVCWIYMHVCHSYSLEARCISRAWADGMWGRERAGLTSRARSKALL